MLPLIKKPTLVLIPGLLSDHSIWQHQIERLKPFATIIVPAITPMNDADCIIDNILSQCPRQFYLAGHSMGGWLAIEMMRHNSSRVLKLCILATSASLDSEKKRLMRRQSLQLVSKATAEEIANYLTGFYSYKPEIVPTIFNMFKRNMSAFVPQQEAMIKRRSCEEILPTIHIPTTVIVGEHDEEFFNSSKYIADNILHSTFIILKNCGHMLLLEQPQACTAAILAWMYR